MLSAFGGVLQSPETWSENCSCDHRTILDFSGEAHVQVI